MFVSLQRVCFSNCFFLYHISLNDIPFDKGYFTHPMLEKRIERLIKEQIESINSDIKVISEEIFQP